MAELIYKQTDINGENFTLEPVGELIRCGECKYNQTRDCAMWYESGEEQYSWNCLMDYCSYGERKDERK